MKGLRRNDDAPCTKAGITKNGRFFTGLQPKQKGPFGSLYDWDGTKAGKKKDRKLSSPALN
jgi:hypothetical protein